MDLLRSLPLGLYLEKPQTWLHKLDPRIKLAWLMSFLTSYIFSNSQWRVLLASMLVITTILARIPLRVWRKQMGWLITVCFLVLLIASISPDSYAVKYQPRLPVNPQVLQPLAVKKEKDPLSTTLSSPSPTNNSTLRETQKTDNEKRISIRERLAIFQSSKEYNYILQEIGPVFGIGPIIVTRNSFDLAIKLSTIFFTVLYGTTLYLLTTAAEEITAGLESLMQPLHRFKLPITEITLTLTLSLRFIPLVLEEVQNLVRSIMTRAINWRKIGWKGSVKVWIMVAEKLLENLLLRAKQMAGAMVARGFTSPNQHKVEWYELRLKVRDWFALFLLALLWGLRFAIGNQV
ncbi:MAG: CbiQ family ECF transporter T component [Cyanobacteria bacterium P01_A01_bin.45]